MFRKTITNPKEYQRQKAALLYFQSPFMVRLLDFDDTKQTLIMEFLAGSTLKSFFRNDEVKSIHLTCDLIKNLHSHQGETHYAFSDLKDWCAYLYKSSPLPKDLLAKAQTLSDALLTTTSNKVLLHGDLHHDNIFLKEGQAIAIDPKSIWGDPLFEPARFILNPFDCILDQPNLKALLTKRIDQFATFFDDKENRIVKWTFVCAMISACWNCEDGFKPDTLIELAKHLQELL